MIAIITQKQIESVIALSGPRRYDHFVKVVSDQDKVWGLYSEGFALCGTEDNKSVFPIWPAEEYAALCAFGEWANYKPEEISLEEVFNWLIPSLKESHTCLGVFYTPKDKGVLPDLDQFVNDLKRELERIE